MSIDRANIFKLSNQELKQYIENPFIDCFESTKSFAEALKYDIDTKETPHILLLSAEYGMGKTFFSTRFTQFLKNNNYDVIYFSVWENDYLQEPFIAFSKEIIKYINNISHSKIASHAWILIFIHICDRKILVIFHYIFNSARLFPERVTGIIILLFHCSCTVVSNHFLTKFVITLKLRIRHKSPAAAVRACKSSGIG